MKDFLDCNAKKRGHQVQDFYEAEAHVYDDSRWASPLGQYVNSSHQKIVFDLMDDCRSERLLEVGPGTGRFSTEIVSRGGDLVGLDISHTMLQKTREKLGTLASDETLCLTNGDATALPFIEGAFDGCICINVFSHVQEPTRVLSEIVRVLRPGGVLIANFPNLYSLYWPYGLVTNCLRKSPRRQVYTRWYTIGWIQSTCRDIGLYVEVIATLMHWPSSARISIPMNMLELMNRLIQLPMLSRLGSTIFVKALRR